jgi:RNA polymerase sigma-70 factor (ECF subfamily)
MGLTDVMPHDSAEKRAREASVLVEAARSGDTGAFDQLVRRFRPRIFALALHLTGSASDADDVTQDAFMRAFSRIREFEGRSAFFTWLYRITLNRAFNMRRDQRRRRSISLNDDRVRMAVAVDASGDPRLQLELRESYGLLVQALDRLSPLLRATVVLTALQGLNYREAAVVLETTESTVAWRVHEARKQLRHTIEKLTREPTPLPRHKRVRVAAELRRFVNGLRLDSTLPDPANV